MALNAIHMPLTPEFMSPAQTSRSLQAGIYSLL